MAFTIPNRGGSYNDDQSIWQDADIDALVRGVYRDGVISGCAVTAQGSPDMTVAVAAGVVQVAGVSAAVTGGNVTIGAADGLYPRLDLISANSSGTKVLTAGTPAGEPTMPTIPASSALLAVVYVPSGATTITTLRIIDKRLLVSRPSTTGAVGSEPASPALGDLYLPNNGFAINRYSGSVWSPWGPNFPFTPPVDGDFAWINQGSASVVTTNGGIYLSVPAEAGTQVRLRKKAAPATPYSITAAFLANYGPNGAGVGLVWRDNTGTKLSLIQAGYTTGHVLGQYDFNSPTSFSGTALANVMCPWMNVIWMRIADNGTNCIVSFSTDGVNFIQLFSRTRTTFLTPNEVGFYVSNVSNNFVLGMTLLSWKEGS